MQTATIMDWVQRHRQFCDGSFRGEICGTSFFTIPLRQVRYLSKKRIEHSRKIRLSTWAPAQVTFGLSSNRITAIDANHHSSSNEVRSLGG
jgi:hypothetical protein